MGIPFPSLIIFLISIFPFFPRREDCLYDRARHVKFPRFFDLCVLSNDSKFFFLSFLPRMRGGGAFPSETENTLRLFHFFCFSDFYLSERNLCYILFDSDQERKRKMKNS